MGFWRRSKHQFSEQELNAYGDGQLSSDDSARLEEHLPSCVACREALAELRSLRSALRALPRAAAPRSFALREADIESTAVAPRVGLLGGAMPMLGGVTAAAVIAFAVLVSVDVSDRGPGGAAGDTENRSSFAAAMEEDTDEFADKLSATPMPEAFQASQDQQKRTDEGPDPATEPSAGVASAADSENAADIETDGSEGILEATPQMSEGLPQTGPDEAPSLPPLGDVTGIDDEVLLEPAYRNAARVLESRGDADGEAPAPAPAEEDEGGYTRVRAAETAMAAVAFASASALALFWWRRRDEERR